MSIRKSGNRKNIQQLTGQFIPVGGFFYLGDLSDDTEVYEVVESRGCSGCYMLNFSLCTMGFAPKCSGIDREDNKSVVFKKL